MARFGPPPIVTAEVKFKCPGGGTKSFTVVGPTADEAIRKAARFDTRAPGMPRFLQRCQRAGIELSQRRPGGLDGAKGKKKAHPLFGDPVAVRRLRTGGYPKRTDRGWVLIGYKDNKEVVLAKGFQRGCTKIRPGARGGWIDSQRCTYNFKFPDLAGGKWYSCRGYGEGVAVSCRRMKKAPPGTGRRGSTYFDGGRR